MKVTRPFKESMIGRRVVKRYSAHNKCVGTIVEGQRLLDYFVYVSWDKPLDCVEVRSLYSLDYFDIDQLRAEMWGFLELAARGIEERKHG